MFEKIQQCATSNIKMLVGGKHIVQHGAANCVHNHHGEMLKRKMTKKITVKTKKEPDGEYAVYRADDTEFDGSDEHLETLQANPVQVHARWTIHRG